MSLTKADIIDSIYNFRYSRSRAAYLFEETLEITKATLESGEGVLISGFGKLCANEKMKGQAVLLHMDILCHQE